MKELEEMGLTWGEAQAKARDKSVWRSFVAALCPRRDEEDEWVSDIFVWTENTLKMEVFDNDGHWRHSNHVIFVTKFSSNKSPN